MIDPDPHGRPAAAPDAIRAGNAEKARALLALIEGRAPGAADVPPDRLRAWARDLIATMENGRAEASPPPVPAAPAPAPVVRLFSAGAPKLFARAEPPLARRGPPAMAPYPVRALYAATPALVARPPVAMSTGPVATAAPARHDPVSRVAPAAGGAALGRADVTRLIAATIDSGRPEAEHPAVIAVTLAGLPSQRQSEALRRLPGGHVRAVHRALRRIEAEA